ncbi:MAG: imelysin family protein [Pseudomonadota bacterium]
MSIPARGFYALEFLLFDPQVSASGDAAYRYALVWAVTGDIAANAAAISNEWQAGYGDQMATPGNSTYRTKDEAARQAFTALLTGLEFTSQIRLGRPMGTFERPRLPVPKRAGRVGRGTTLYCR